MKYLRSKPAIVIGILSALAVGFILWWFFGSVAYAPEPEELSYPLPTTELRINEAVLTVEIAKTIEDKQLGLSGRSSLPENHGMIFTFEQPGFYPFWMKEVNFPLDIIWLNKDFEVVTIRKNLSPDTYPETFAPTAHSVYVLEANAGFADKYEVKLGDKAFVEL